MAAFTASNVVNTVWGDRKAVICRITGDASAYTAGGDVVLPSWFGMKYVDYIIFQSMDAGQANYPIYLRGASGAAPKIYQFVQSSGAQFSGNNDKVFDVIVIGQ